MRGLWTGIVVLGAVLAAAGPAKASMPFGADLSVGGAGVDCGTGGCIDTITPTAGTSPDDQYGVVSVVVGANDGSTAAAPVSGVLVSFSVRLATAHSGRVRLLQDPGGGAQINTNEHMTLAGTGNTVSVPGDSVSHSFPTRLPITQGEYIGFEVQGTGAQETALYRTSFGSSTADRRMRWYAGTTDGGSDPPEFTLNGATAKNQAPVSGVIEPDADGDGFGDQSQDQCPGQAGATNGCPPAAATPVGGGIPGPVTPVVAPKDTTAPVLSPATLTHRVFRVASKAQAAATPAGTTIRLRSSEGGTATLSLYSLTTGRKVGKRCVKQTGHNRHKKPCQRTAAVTGLKKPVVAGANKVPFSGRVHVGTLVKTLRPGKYQLKIRVADAAGNKSNTVTTTFTIVR